MFYIYNIAWSTWKNPPHSRYPDGHDGLARSYGEANGEDMDGF